MELHGSVRHSIESPGSVASRGSWVWARLIRKTKDLTEDSGAQECTYSVQNTSTHPKNGPPNFEFGGSRETNRSENGKRRRPLRLGELKPQPRMAASPRLPPRRVRVGSWWFLSDPPVNWAWCGRCFGGFSSGRLGGIAR